MKIGSQTSFCQRAYACRKWRFFVYQFVTGDILRRTSINTARIHDMTLFSSDGVNNDVDNDDFCGKTATAPTRWHIIMICLFPLYGPAYTRAIFTKIIADIFFCETKTTEETRTDFYLRSLTSRLLIMQRRRVATGRSISTSRIGSAPVCHVWCHVC